MCSKNCFDEAEKEKDILVSVIIPVYNEFRYLESCILSALNQTWKHLELILVDDGSESDVAKICDKYAKLDQRVKVIHKQNEGLSAARITGLKQAAGKWILFMDHDDVAAQNLVEELIGYVDETVDIIAGGRIDGEKVKDNWRGKSNVKHMILSGPEASERISEIPRDRQKTIITPLWGKLYRSEFINAIDLEQYKKACPTIFFEDVLMTPILYYYARNICIVCEPYYFHREVKTSISRSGKMSSFYYDQINSGDILLAFCKEKSLPALYAYELGIYMKTILRIWCLMEQSLGETVFLNYQKNILKFYHKYLRDYLKLSKASIFEKAAVAMFRISPNGWKKFARRILFRGKR